MNLTGQLFHNNEPFQKSMRRRIAYVLQEDLFFDELTVRQQLYITAQLRLPDTLSPNDKQLAVDNVLHALHITKCADTKIKLVSGGERKRCNIGTELLTNPSVILLDEPTSGLDSSVAHSLIETLRELTLQDMTIVCSIHQPSSRIFYSFDKLLLLVDGRTVYFGSPHMCLDYFGQLGLYPPSDYNPADFVMDLLNDSHPTGEEAVMSHIPSLLNTRSGNNSSTPSFTTHTMKKSRHNGSLPLQNDTQRKVVGAPPLVAVVLSQDIDEGPPMEGECATWSGEEIIHKEVPPDTDTVTSSRSSSVTPSESSVLGLEKEDEVMVGIEAQESVGSVRSRLIDAWDGQGVDMECKRYVNKGMSEGTSGYHQSAEQLGDTIEVKFQASYRTQFKALFHRALLVSGHSVFSKLQIAQTISVALLCGVCWWDMSYSEDRVDDRAGFIFFFMTFWFYLNLYQGLLQFQPERNILLKERAAGSYRLSAYYLSKTLSELPVKLTLPFVFLLISFPMAALSHSVPVFLGVCGIQLLCALAGESIGLFMGTVSTDIMRALIVGNFISLTLTLAGGYYVTNLPLFISWMKYLSPFKYSYDACLKLTFDRRIPCRNGAVLVICADDYVDFAEREDVWTYLGAEGSVEMNCILLITFIALFRVAAYLSLRFISHNNGRK